MVTEAGQTTDVAASGTPFRLAHAEAPDWAAACDRVAGELRGAEGANLGIVFVSDRFGPQFGEVVGRLRQATGIADWLGSVGIGVCATGTEYFDRPAIVAMAGALPADSYALFHSGRDDLNAFVQQRRDWCAAHPGNFGIVHVDPAHGAALQAVPQLAEATNAFLVGALTSSRAGGGHVAGHAGEGALSGMLLSGEVAVMTGLSQGCTPIGEPHTVTRADGNVAIELDGRPALDVFKDDVGEVLARDLRRVAGTIFAAVPVRGSDTGDYMVRNLTGFDTERGLVGIGEMLETGQTLMFCRRDSDSAVADLRRMVEGLAARLERPPRAALYHTCLARGPNMFGAESAELRLIQEALGDVPLAGFFANGEISNARLYTYTGVLSLIL